MRNRGVLASLGTELDPRFSCRAPHLLETRPAAAVDAIWGFMLSPSLYLALGRTRGARRNPLAVALANAIGNLAVQPASFLSICTLRKARSGLSIDALSLQRAVIDAGVQTGLSKCLVRQRCPTLAEELEFLSRS